MGRYRVPLFAKENLFQLKELLEDCPGLIVVAVNQGPHSLDRHLRPLMDAFPNLHVDTSYMLVEGLIEELCERYGPERLLFGSAFPDNCSGGALLRLARADIGNEAKTLIAGGNLVGLLGWAAGTPSAGTAPRTARETGDAATATNPSPIAAEYIAEGRSSHCPIVDLHGHWGPLGSSYLPCAREEVMLRALHRAGVAHRLLRAHDALFAEPERGNRSLGEAVARNLGVLSAYWAVNPNYARLAARAPTTSARVAAS